MRSITPRKIKFQVISLVKVENPRVLVGINSLYEFKNCILSSVALLEIFVM